MGLDFYWLDEGSTTAPLVTLDAGDLKFVESALADLEAATGIFVDPYGRTRVSPAHASLLGAQLSARIQSLPKSPASGQCLAQFLGVLNEAAAKGRWLLADGD